MSVKLKPLYKGQEVVIQGDQIVCVVAERTGNGVYSLSRKGITISGIARNRLCVKSINCGQVGWISGPVNERL